MNMHICAIPLRVVLLSCLLIAGAVSSSCKPNWKIDWNRQPPNFSNFEPFSHPGEILPGVTVHDILQFVGQLWNAPSWQEVMGRFCIHCGPFLHILYPEEQIRETCDMIVTSLQKGEKYDISGMCTSYLQTKEVESAARMSRYHKYFRFLDFLPGDVERLGIDLAFGLLKLLGPSPFSGDVYGACSEVRLLLSENIDETVTEVKIFLSYLVGSATLKVLESYVCTNEDHEVWTFLDWILEDICDFLSTDYLYEEYVEKVVAFADVLLSVPLNVDLCTDVIGFLSSYDEFGATGYSITKRNLKFRSNRRQFCRKIVSALTGNTRAHTYIFPHNYDIENWYVFAEAGQILPEFYFLDAVNVFGAFIRSDTFSDGGVVLCDVFESFLFQEFDPSIKDICAALRIGDTATVETKCRSLFPPATHSDTPKTKSTVMFTIVTAVNMTTKLLNLSAITRERVCSALNFFLYSKNNLQSVIRFGLNAYLTDILPLANFHCQHHRLVFAVIEAGMDPAIFTIFKEIVLHLNDFMLTHLGFSNQKQICQSIAAGIETSSGQAKSSLIKNMEDAVLKFLTDTGRCTASVKSLQKLYANLGAHFYGDVTQNTGYSSLTHFCETMGVMFGPDRCEDSLEENFSSYCSLKNPFQPETNVCMKIEP